MILMISRLNIQTPVELVDELSNIFPQFADEWDGGEGYGYQHPSFSYHSVFLTFTPLSQAVLSAADLNQLRSFCHLVNYLVERGGDLENAVSTCFLEHASQVGVRKLIKPYLSAEAKAEWR